MFRMVCSLAETVRSEASVPLAVASGGRESAGFSGPAVARTAGFRRDDGTASCSWRAAEEIGFRQLWCAPGYGRTREERRDVEWIGGVPEGCSRRGPADAIGTARVRCRQCGQGALGHGRRSPTSPARGLICSGMLVDGTLTIAMNSSQGAVHTYRYYRLSLENVASSRIRYRG